MIFGKLKLLINIQKHVLGITKHTCTHIHTHFMMCVAEKLVNVSDVVFENKEKQHQGDQGGVLRWDEMFAMEALGNMWINKINKNSHEMYKRSL